MEKRTKYLIKNTSILALSNFSSKILVFLLVPIYTSVLTTEEYGTYDLIMSTIQLVMPILSLNISDAVLRFMLDESVNKNEVKAIGLRYSIVAVVLFGCALGINYQFGFFEVLKTYGIYAFLYFLFFLMNQLLIQTTKGEEKVKELAIAGVLSTFTSLVFNIIFLIYIPKGVYGFFSAYILGQAVSVVYLMIKTKFYKGIEFNNNKELRCNMLRYAIPLILTALGWWVNNVSDRYVVVWLCGLAVNGVYSISYKIPTIITNVQNIFIQAWTISAIREYENKDSIIFYKKMFILLNCLMVFSAGILIIFIKILAKILFANDFYSAWIYVPFLLVSCVFGAAAGFIGQILSAKKDTSALAKSTVAGAIVNIVFNIILVFILGAQGAAISTAIANFIVYIVRRKAIGNVFLDKQYMKVLISWMGLIILATMSVVEISFVFQTLSFVLIMFSYRTLFSNAIAVVKKRWR